ncbi:retrotransposon protein [Cucumis melo var. makuwa]|uniref:Retrotransposon protein n=1 Tax=Cucumis melo var. makuwa TaxID=1194695 RepID=A0A5A7U768_CUCMM|nr:retrotransposon protein [Cucumis melo var. makuwa]TYJ98191.1 retrotransposon protein [Cucumis melo var. makuwa]
MTNGKDLDDVDEGDLMYATTIIGDDIQYIETANECGFGWNDEAKCIIAKKELFDNWVKFEVLVSHLAVKGLFNKLFPYYDELAYVFERDRATGHFVETFVDVESNEPIGYEGFDIPNGNDMKFLSMYSQGTDMSSNDVHALRPGRASNGRTDRADPSKREEASRRVRLR